MIQILKITTHKKRFLPLLLLGDEQEDMIDRYLDDSEMFALYDGGLKTIAVVSREPKRVYELKNLATDPAFQKKGYGRHMVRYLLTYYHGRGRIMQVGTGADSANVAFYEKCGFTVSHTIKNFFTDHYDHPIFEDGKPITDMVYLQKEL